jgi:hypothetical protein
LGTSRSTFSVDFFSPWIALRRQGVRGQARIYTDEFYPPIILSEAWFA